MRVACNRAVPYCASDLEAAYGVTQIAKTSGKGALVAIVGAYGYPNAASDLAVYRKTMGLPPCATGCLQVVNQSGRSRPLPKPNSSDDWRLEQALDLDMVSAICPNCRILLVQSNGDKNSDLALGANAAVALGAVSVANPYSSKEDDFGQGAYRHPGHAITASAGNEAGVTASPCSYSGVVCVGGTSLLAASSKRGWNERPWGSGGSGCSAYVSKPAWQRVKGCATRNEVDVAAVADPATGVAAYGSFAGGWQQMGGTSTAATIVAALFALGSNAARANAPQWIWRHGPGAAYHHVGSGSGYDRESGWGTPAGVTGF